ncbi:MAG: hypothetical protein H6825_13160 [Planctomycetes bacterium]|nr:hypothetical protein [Planctomycetota bacterium]
MSVARLLCALLVTLLAVVPRAAAADDASPPRSETVVSEGGVTVEAPAGALLVGQWFELVIHGPFADDAQLALAPDQDALLFDGEPERTVEVDRVVWVLKACALRDGELPIEGMSITSAGTTLPVPSFRLSVSSGLDPDVVPRMAGPLGPVELPHLTAPWGPFVWPQVLLLALLFMSIVRGTRVVPVFVRRTPPDQLAIEALGRLRLRLPSGPEGVVPFVVEVSDVLRRYIEGRFDLHAPARTTEEFLIEVARRDDAVAEREETLGGFLTACDLVKFARARPGREELLHLLGTAETFVEETRFLPSDDDTTVDDELDDADASPSGARAPELVA